MMKQLLLAALASLPLLQSCSQANSYSGSSYAERPKTAEELRAELLASEEQLPDEYLKIKGTSRRNLLNQLVLEGTITNTASLANFKDPVLSVTWFSKTDTELETKEYRLFEAIRAHRSKEFKMKTDAPGYVATVAMGVSEATPIE